MKKVLGCLAVLGMVFGWILPLYGETNPKQSISSSYLENEITISISFSEPIITKARIPKLGDFDRVMIKEAFNTGNSGEPVLPAKGLSVLLPYNKEVSEIEVVYFEEIELKGTYTIEPGQKPYPISLALRIIWCKK